MIYSTMEGSMIDDATIKRVAEESGANSAIRPHVSFSHEQLAAFARAIEQLARQERREEILDDIGEALSYDFENGVKCLNEAAAEKFRDDYPNLIDTLEAIRASGKENSNEQSE